MSLKSVLSKAEYDALADPLKALYVADGDKFVLDAEIESHPKALNLKTALDKERTDKETANKQFRALRDKIGDMDPEEARKALGEIQKLRDKKMLDEGQIEELFKLRTEQMQTAHTTQVKAFEKQIGDGKTVIDSLTGQLRTMRINDKIKTMAVEKKIRREAIDDAIARFTVVGIDGVKWDLDDKGDVVAKRGDQVAYGKDATRSMSFDEGFDVLLTKAPHLFETSAGGGANNDAGKTAQGGSHKISAADAKQPEKYRAAKDAAEKVGATLTIEQPAA